MTAGEIPDSVQMRDDWLGTENPVKFWGDIEDMPRIIQLLASMKWQKQCTELVFDKAGDNERELTFDFWLSSATPDEICGLARFLSDAWTTPPEIGGLDAALFHRDYRDPVCCYIDGYEEEATPIGLLIRGDFIMRQRDDWPPESLPRASRNKAR